MASLELQKIGVTVNAVAPVALTRMTSDLAMMKGATAEDLGPHHVAPAVVFLASELAADLTGQVLGVEGGRIFVYRMETSPGVSRDAGEGPWTAEAIRAAWQRISGP